MFYLIILLFYSKTI